MLLLLLSTAQATDFDGISLLAMQDYSPDGEQSVSTEAEHCDNPVSPDCSDYVTTGYQQVVRELGSAIGNKPSLPAHTLGVNGFAFGLSNTVAFIRTGTLDGVNPSGWDLMAKDDDGPVILLIPTLQFRKGLPFSLEAGLNVGWIAVTQTAAVSAYGRWGLLEGWKQLPDVTLQIGYAGYVGNDELELGTFDADLTIGYSLAFGRTAEMNSSIFSPFVGFGLQRFHAAPRINLSNTSLADRLPEVSGWKADDDLANEKVAFDKQFAPFTVGGGFRIQSGAFTFTASADYTVGAIATVHTGFGFVY